jgi:hypothetical protein
MISARQIKRQLSNAAEIFAPTAALVALRREAHMQRYFRRIGLAALEERLAAAAGQRVLQGPFKGMLYGRTSSGSVWAPKALGCYEEELHAVVEEVVSLAPARIIDLGCAEGYYAGGFAFRLPQTEILAADLNPVARHRTSRLARINAAGGKLSTTGRVDRNQLQDFADGCSGVVVVWCDIEGGEYSLMDPSEITALRRAFIVIEDHSGMIGRRRDELIGRLQKFHDIQIVVQTERSLSSIGGLPGADSFNSEELGLLCCEHRPPWQSWVVARPRLRA